MPGILNYICPNDHRFQKVSSKDRVKCPMCKKMSEILWISDGSSHQQLQTPIVMWRYSDGRLGVAGGADSKTPKNAERVEIRSIGEYRRYANQINSQLKSKEDMREERFAEGKERWEKTRRSNLAWQMGQETDPLAKDIYREALNRGSSGSAAPSFQEFYSIVMENDRSNYE